MLLLKCNKNLVISDQILIMKDDVVQVLGQETIESKDGENALTWFDIEVKSSQFCPGMELSLPVHQIAEHFEYDFKTVYKPCRVVQLK